MNPAFIPASPISKVKRYMRVRLEQTRQARQIHGGWLNLAVASAGVRLARVPIPTARLRRAVYGHVYGGKYPRLTETELERPLGEYRSLNELFARGAGPRLHPKPASPQQIVSPCDGRVQAIGRLRQGTLITAKHTRYSLASLLPRTDTGSLLGGDFAVVFLSPRDCHRIFTPQRGKLTAVTHVPGYRLPVHPPFQRPEFPVFTLNERVIMEYEMESGRCVLVMVAGWGVGHITHPFPLPVRRRSGCVSHLVPSPPLTFRPGEWLATFELGSTVILVVEPRPGRRAVPRAGSSVRIGCPVFDVPIGA